MNAQGDQQDCGCIPDRACERTGCPVGLEMDQESIGIALVFVGVCDGDAGRLECRFDTKNVYQIRMDFGKIEC